MNEDIAIKIENVSKDFILPHQKANSVKSIFTGLSRGGNSMAETQHALKDITFEVKKGEFFGIVGRNGSGKSTLLKIIAEIYRPTKGSVTKSGRLVPFIELGVGFNPELTGRENVYLNGALLGFSTKEIDDQYDDIVQFAELDRFMDQKLKNYSSGMQVRLAFAVATRAKADILLVDEVLAVGDSDFQKKCYNYFKKIKKDKTTVIFVTHDMNAVREYCDRAMLIDDSKLQLIGKPDRVAVEYSKLFSEASAAGTTDEKENRWGSHKIEFTKVTVSKKIEEKDKEITIIARAIAHETLESLITGFSVRNQAGVTILGTNSKLQHQDIEHCAAGNTFTFEWQIPNIFNLGNYTVDVALVDQNGVDVFDWWEEAAIFTVDKELGNPYVVYPDMKLKVSKVMRGSQ